MTDPRDLAQQWLAEKIRAFYDGRQNEPFTEDELAAEVLASVQAEVQWGARLRWPDGHTEDHWGDGRRELAERRVKLHDGKHLLTTGTLISRSTLRLPAQPVTEEQR